MPDGLSPWVWVALAVAPLFPLLGMLVGELTPPNLGEHHEDASRHIARVIVLWAV